MNDDKEVIRKEVYLEEELHNRDILIGFVEQLVQQPYIAKHVVESSDYTTISAILEESGSGCFDKLCPLILDAVVQLASEAEVLKNENSTLRVQVEAYQELT